MCNILGIGQKVDGRKKKQMPCIQIIKPSTTSTCTCTNLFDLCIDVNIFRYSQERADAKSLELIFDERAKETTNIETINFQRLRRTGTGLMPCVVAMSHDLHCWPSVSN